MQIAARAAAPAALAPRLDRQLVALSRLLRGHATDAGLSITALSVLRRLSEGACRVTELAAGEAVAQPSMTALVGRLEARGLLRREPDASDGRAVRVVLTEEGDALLRAVRAARTAVLRDRLRRLAPAEREALATALPALDQLLDPDQP
jgi:DNA-binding MarR family transcriptional regulator